MTIEQLRLAHHARPFCPFLLQIDDGRQLRVRKPEYLSCSPTGATITVFGQKDDSFSIVGLGAISDLKFESKGPASNGSRKKKRRRNR